MSPPPPPPPFRLSSVTPKPLPPGYRMSEYAARRLAPREPPRTRFDYFSEDLGLLLERSPGALVRLGLEAIQPPIKPSPTMLKLANRKAAVARTLLETALVRSSKARKHDAVLHPRIAARAHAGLYNIYVDMGWYTEAEAAARNAVDLLRQLGSQNSSAHGGDRIDRELDGDEEKVLGQSPSDALLRADLSTALAATVVRNDAGGDCIARARRIIPLLTDSLRARRSASAHDEQGLLANLHAWSVTVRMLADAYGDVGDPVRAYEAYSLLLRYSPRRRIARISGPNYFVDLDDGEDSDEVEVKELRRREGRRRRRVRKARQMPMQVGNGNANGSTAGGNEDSVSAGSESDTDDNEERTPELVENAKIRRRAAAVRRMRNLLHYRMAMLIVEHQLSSPALCNDASTNRKKKAVPVGHDCDTSSFSALDAPAGAGGSCGGEAKDDPCFCEEMTLRKALELLETCCRMRIIEEDPTLWWNSVTAVRGLLHGSAGWAAGQPELLRKAIKMFEDALDAHPRAWRDDPFEVSEIRFSLSKARRELRKASQLPDACVSPSAA